MPQATIQVTVLLENQFWAAIFERKDKAGYAVARQVFGDEPTDPELYAFITAHYYQLKFTTPQTFKLIIKRKNPKRMKRDVIKQMAKTKQSSQNNTYAQEVLRLELEKNKKIKKSNAKAEKEAKQQKVFLLKQAKKKKKHRGH